MQTFEKKPILYAGLYKMCAASLILNKQILCDMILKPLVI